jgi:hypothetical protein
MSTSIAAAPPATSRGLVITLWVAQVLLALAFGAGGAMKLGPLPPEALNQTGPLVPPEGLIRFIGVAEVAGAIGVVLPALLRVKPFLTWLAAAGLLVIMVLATALHLYRAEFDHVLPCAVLGALAAFVAWGRASKAPVAPR